MPALAHNSPDLPLADAVLRVAESCLDREAFLVFRDDSHLDSITWRHFMRDVCHRADYLVKVTGIVPRQLDQNAVTIALLAESTYDFIVTFVAILFLRWTVSPSNPKIHASFLNQIAARTYFASEFFGGCKAYCLLHTVSTAAYRGNDRQQLRGHRQRLRFLS
jgi:acyl-CoA synthetase (AMP-forming)/AMP-acid ligase II